MINMSIESQAFLYILGIGIISFIILMVGLQ